MKRLILAVLLGITLLPAGSFAHDRRSSEAYDRRVDNENRPAQRGDPGYYCHKHKRQINREDTRKHCHSAYNDEHNPDSWRDYSRRRYSGWFSN